MPRRRKTMALQVGPSVQFISARYVRDQSTRADFRTREVQALISEVILLARRRGRPKREKEVRHAV